MDRARASTKRPEKKADKMFFHSTYNLAPKMLVAKVESQAHTKLALQHLARYLLTNRIEFYTTISPNRYMSCRSKTRGYILLYMFNIGILKRRLRAKILFG